MTVPGGISGELENLSIIDVIGDIYMRRLSGILELVQRDSTRRFFFKEGEIYLPASHVLAEKLRGYLQAEEELIAGAGEEVEEHRVSGGGTAGAAARKELESLVERIVAVLVEWRDGHYSFDEGAELPSEIVGPLPTAYLTMEGAVFDRSPSELLAQLGGEEALLVARTDSDLLIRLYGIDPEQMFLLSRAEEPISVGELLRQVSIDRTQTLRKLCRLHAVGLLDGLAPAAEGGHKERLVDNLVEKFSERIARRLETDQIALDATEHRSRLADLLRDFGGMSHYEILGVGVHASEEEIHVAYDELARLVHPSHATRLGLTGKEGALGMLFERATVAYLTLADSERRASYNAQAGIDSTRRLSEHARTREQEELARESYDKALARFEAEDYHFALELIQRALQADERAEYFALRGRIEARNPHWLDQSVKSFRSALNMDPGNPEYRAALGRVMEGLGDLDAARLHYKVALKERPGLPEALEGLERVGPGTPRPSLQEEVSGSPERGLMSRIRQFFRE